MNSNNKEVKIIFDILYDNQEKNHNTFTIIDGFHEENENIINNEEENNNNDLLYKEKDYTKYPFNLIQEIEVNFSYLKSSSIYNSFIIYRNIILTISKNVYSIKRKEYINKLKLSNLNLEFYSDINNKYDSENTFHIFIEDIENENSLAMIIFNKEINNEYFGICDSQFLFDEEEEVKGYLICKNRFSEKRNLTIQYINVKYNSLINEIKTFEKEENKIYNIKKEKENNKKIKKILLENEENDNKEILSFSGSPIIRKLFEGLYYVIGYVDSNLKIIDLKETHFQFIYQTFNRGILFLKENNKGIEEEEIKFLDLSHKVFLSKKKSNFFEMFFMISLNHLKSINLSYSKINDNCLKYISKGNYFSLRELNLSNNLISENGIEYLINCTFKNIDKLNLKNNNIKSKGIYYLTQCCFANKLYILNLNNNKIDDEGINYLENNTFSILYKFYLNNNNLTNNSVKYFEKIDLNNLKFLFLFKNKLLNDENLIQKIKLKFPLTAIFAGKNNFMHYKIFIYCYKNFKNLFSKYKISKIHLEEENMIIKLNIININEQSKYYKLKKYNECIGGIFLYEINNIEISKIKNEFDFLKNLHNLRNFKTMLLGNNQSEIRDIDFDDILNLVVNYNSSVKEFNFQEYSLIQFTNLLSDFLYKIFENYYLNKTSLKK